MSDYLDPELEKDLEELEDSDSLEDLSGSEDLEYESEVEDLSGSEINVESVVESESENEQDKEEIEQGSESLDESSIDSDSDEELEDLTGEEEDEYSEQSEVEELVCSAPELNDILSVPVQTVYNNVEVAVPSRAPLSPRRVRFSADSFPVESFKTLSSAPQKDPIDVPRHPLPPLNVSLAPKPEIVPINK